VAIPCLILKNTDELAEKISVGLFNYTDTREMLVFGGLLDILQHDFYYVVLGEVHQ
jgi:hypothetical protein